MICAVISFVIVVLKISSHPQQLPAYQLYPSVIIDTPYPVTEAFPQLFNPSLIDTDGLLLSKSANPADGNPLIKRPTPVTSIPLMARLKTSAELSQVVLAASKAVGGILNSVRAGGGANWSSVLNGTDHDHHHSSSNASPSSVMRMFEEGNKGLNREEFSTIREELEELAARYRDN